MLREIPVAELRYGMYVARLDRPWEGTPFVFQGFVLANERQMEALRRLCRTVFVDPERGEEAAAPGGAAALAAQQARENVRGATAYPLLASVEDELRRSRTAYAQTRAMFEDVIGAVGSGEVLDGPRLREAIACVADSVVRNPDAMMLLAKMAQKGSSLAVRALDVSIYMVVFGRFLQLARAQLETLGLLGLLQDVGKLRVDAELLDRAAPLTAGELERVRSHVRHSVEILQGTAGLPDGLPALAALHHERQDGSGYPKGLKGPQIGLIGAIAGLVDAFDALTVPRPYAPHLSPSNALGMLYKGRGTLFHAALVEQFIQCIGIYPVGSAVELSSGEIGVVIAQNPARRLQPRVMVLRDAAGNPKRPQLILDLAREPGTAAGEPYRIRRALEYDRAALDPREIFV